MSEGPARISSRHRAGDRDRSAVQVTVRMRLAARGVRIAGWLACHLPESWIWRLAGLAGWLNYRISRERRDLARRNLRRVLEWMAANHVGEERYRRAAKDRRALEALVRAAFRHHATYYVEMLRAPLYTAKLLDERLLVETPEAVADAFRERRALILLGMHFGAIELPALFCATHIGPIVAPMETLRNPLIQRYLEETRGRMGMLIVDLEHAGTEMTSALRRNEPVGFVAERDIQGNGSPVELFGAQVRLPRGPALLAVESGAPVYAGAVRRSGPGRYRGRIAEMTIPTEGTRRQRMQAFLEEEARMFEEIVSHAPEQWWAVFSPIWTDATPEGASEA